MARDPAKNETARLGPTDPSASTGVAPIDDRMRTHSVEPETEYRAIFESTIDGLIILDMDGTIVEANAALCEMLGYVRDELIGLNAAVLIPPEILPRLAQALLCAAEGDPIPPEAASECLRKDGSRLDVETRGRVFPYRGEAHLLFVVRDITERIRAAAHLREREAEYGAVFEATTDGLVVNDLETGVIVEVNPAFCRMHGYTHEEMVGMHPSVHIRPDFHSLFAEYLGTVRRGETFHTEAVDVRKDGTTFDVDVVGRAFTFRGMPSILGIVRDISERVRAEEQLREKEEQYRSIFESTNDALIITDFEGFCVEANPAACRLYGYAYGELIGKNAGEVTHPDYHELAGTFVETVRAGGTIEAQSVNLRKDGTPFHIETRASQLLFRGEPHILAVIRDISEQVTARELLEQRVEERTRELSTLLEVSHNVSSTLELQPLLDLILDQVAEVAEYAGASISLIEGDESQIVAFRGRGSAEVAVGLRVPVERMDPAWESWRSGPFIIDDVRADTLEATAYRRSEAALLDASFSYVRSWMAAPLIVNERLVGVLTLNSDQPGLYTPHHADLVMGIANQAAIAIENARLYERAQEVAVLEERQRLSRELHDSVSQALYGIGLGAQTARAVAESNPSQVIQPLDYVLSLARTAMSEMRGLIFELRPETVEQEGLVAVLRQQASAASARHGIRVTMAAVEEPDAPPGIKEALYRIAQEALHNAVKHAGATEIALALGRDDHDIVLTVQDNGKGFDPGDTFPGHLGLYSMRERAERLGGTLDIRSAPRAGTTVSVRISLAQVG